MSVTLRLLKAEKDVSAFRALRSEAISSAPESFGQSQAEMLRQTDQYYQRILSPQGVGDFVLGAFRESTLVGIVGFYHQRSEKVSHKGTIWGLYVQPDHRGCGVAGMLLEETLARVRAVGRASYVKLSVVTENRAAVALYQRLGFSIYGTEPCALKLNDACYDEYHMQLRLREQSTSEK
jgi:ribosomal protein S18 acetylase RimI-like enzyme